MSKLWSGRDDAGKQILSPPGSSLRLELHFRNGGPSISGMNHTALEDKLGYRFNNPDLLVQALTHPSTDSKPETRRAYERLNSWETPSCSWPSHSTFTTTCPNPRKGN